jgi:pimeloyl-ACP methyl ester carboxylesterase
VEVIRTNGLEIAYERVGAGRPLVFAHGAASDARLWRPQLAPLADEFTVVAWDEPWAGRSSSVPARFGLTDYADCLAALIEALALGPAHVAGISWGGTVVQELYRHRPEDRAWLRRPRRDRRPRELGARGRRAARRNQTRGAHEPRVRALPADPTLSSDPLRAAAAAWRREHSPGRAGPPLLLQGRADWPAVAYAFAIIAGRRARGCLHEPALGRCSP